MAPKLYYTPSSCPARAVLLTAKAINLQFEEKLVNLLDGDQLKDEYLKLNPQHTVPTLVEEDGFVLWDSHAIMAYLISKYAKTDELYPKNDIKKRAVIDQRLHFDSGVLFARGLQIVRPIILGETTDIPEDKLKALHEAYGFLEKFLQGNQFVAGKNLTIADFSIATTLTTWDVVVPVEDDYPNIKAWIKRMQALPYYDINQTGVDSFKNIILEKLSS